MQVKELKCPNCGSNIPDTSRSCAYCGTNLVLSQDRTSFVMVGVVCAKCGTNNREMAQFCKECGSTLVKECPACGSTIDVNATHCTDCGKNYSAAEKQLIETVDTLNSKLEKKREFKKSAWVGAIIGLGLWLMISSFAQDSTISIICFWIGMACVAGVWFSKNEITKITKQISDIKSHLR